MSFTRGSRHANGFPKPGEELKDVPSRHTRDGWTHKADHNSVQLAGKQYRHMREWSRACAVCGSNYSVFEKSGQADPNSRFSNRTCDAHRGLLPAFEKGFIAWNTEANAIVAGPMCSGAAPEEFTETKKERDEAWEANITLMQSNGDLTRRHQAIFEELQGLKARLATYELHGAISGVAQKKMPWE